MSIKLIVLKSGENIISDVQEMIVNDQVIGYFLKNPCVVRIKNIQIEIENENNKTIADITLNPWIPLSKDETIPVTSDWVITIVEPISNVKNLYEQTINRIENDNN